MKEKENVKLFVKKVAKEEWEEALDKSFKKAIKTVKIDGFREGKVPKDVFIKKYGLESLFSEAINIVLPKVYETLMEENPDIMPVVQPTVDIKEVTKEAATFEFKVITAPKVTIKKYKGLNVTKEKVEVTTEEVKEEIDKLLERFSELVEKEGPLENTDTAIINFEGFKDNIPFEGGKADNYSLVIGSNTFIPGFEEQLIGMKKNDEKDVNLTFPTDYQAEDLAGKEVVFKVKLNEIKEKKNRELDDTLFEDLGMEGVNSKETLEEEVKETIRVRKEEETENKYVDILLDKVADQTDIDVPEEMVLEETNRLLGRYEEQLKMQGISLELYYQLTHSTEEELKSKLEKEAHKHVFQRLMIDEIIKQEKLEVSMEDADKEASTLADKYKMKKEEFLSKFGGVDLVKYDLEIRKTIELLKELNK
ncbi:MAG: trigger factor [Bacilli bacterium]